MNTAAIAQALARLETWLETMRGPDGYGGPVAHWWQNCLPFTGAGLDWRYEGLIIGYLNLYHGTNNERWLTKARRAGNDLVQGQLPSGSFRNSCFELNPYSEGTPHEAACDLGLLHLAAELQRRGDSSWQSYQAAAEENIRDFQIAVLWDEDARSFRDHPRIASFVPNKACTLAEALFKLTERTGDESWIQVYATPTLQAVLTHQVQGGSLDGAIAQYSQAGRMVRKYFPFYIARCVPGLLLGYQHGGEERFLDAARRAMAFVWRTRYADGSFPQVVYPGGRTNRYPQWIAAVGDILRAAKLLAPYGFDADVRATEDWLGRGQLPHGGVRTAHGFASQVSQRVPGALSEFRDLLPVVGWNDKAFRYWTQQLPEGEPLGPAQYTGVGEEDCLLRGRQCLYREDHEAVELHSGKRVLYHWIKGADWAKVCAPELMWK